MTSLAVRQRQAELMDDPGADPRQLRRSLRFIRRINALMGYTRATLIHLDRFSRRWTPGQSIRIVDLGTGSADIPRAIMRWAVRKGFDMRIVAIDRHAATAALAARACAHEPRIQVLQADVLEMPLPDKSFDYALTAMFLHHLDDEQIVAVLRTMDRLATRGVIVADLLRTAAAYRWIKLFTTFSNPMVRHDARVSIQQAFTAEEIENLRDRAGISYARYHAHFGHRFVLAGERPA